MFFFVSDHHAYCSKSGGSSGNWESVHASLVLRHEGHIINILIGLVSRVDIVSQESLQQVVELIGVYSL